MSTCISWVAVSTCISYSGFVAYRLELGPPPAVSAVLSYRCKHLGCVKLGGYVPCTTDDFTEHAGTFLGYGREVKSQLTLNAQLEWPLLLWFESRQYKGVVSHYPKSFKIE